MFIDLRKAPEGLSSADTVYTFPEELREIGNMEAEFPASVSVRRCGGRLLVSVDYVCRVRMECARCCRSFDSSIDGSVSFVLRSQAEPEESDDLDEYVYESEDDKIDFSQSVYDDLMVRVPVKPLCDEQCPGFECSSDTEDAVEVKPKTDDRWAVLAKLKK